VQPSDAVDTKHIFFLNSGSCFAWWLFPDFSSGSNFGFDKCNFQTVVDGINGYSKG